MSEKIYTEIIRQAAINLLQCDDNYAVMKQSVDQMYQVFSQITGITINQLNEDKDIMLPSGKAISSAAAAHCLLEMKRTAIFLRGISKAISKKLNKNKGKQIRILYAGTGPYGTLVVPLLSLYFNYEIKVDLIDINSNSLDALQKILATLDFSEYIGRIYCTDATSIKLDYQYDIVISETMQACLKNEPQVAIFQNLAPQCKADTIFIPEQITIDAYLKKRGIWDGDQLLIEGGETTFIGELFSVSKDNLEKMKYRRILDLSPSLYGPYDLLLYTTIKVFDNEELGVNDCSLNMPIRYFELRSNYPKSIAFWYNQSKTPKIEFKYLDYSNIKS